MNPIFKDIIVGGAIGDAIGYKIEFHSWQSIKLRYGEQGTTPSYFNREFIVSDDTQMTLFCFEAIKSCLNRPSADIDVIQLLVDIEKQFMFWLMTQNNQRPEENLLNNFNSLNFRRAPGSTCLKALMFKNKGTIEKPVNDSAGCGGIMRVAPIAFLSLDDDATFELGCRQAVITHGNPLGWLSSGFFAVMLKNLIENKDLQQAYDVTKQVCLKSGLFDKTKHSEFTDHLNLLERVISEETVLIHDELITALGTGSTGHTALGVSLYSVYKSNTFKELLNISINHSGDSDSTGSLACQLYVALHGLPENIKNANMSLDVDDALTYQFK